MSNSNLILTMAVGRINRAAKSGHLADWHSALGFLDALVLAESITQAQYKLLHDCLMRGEEVSW